MPELEKFALPSIARSPDRADPDTSVYKTPPGLNESVVRAISHIKNEPLWMRNFRLQALKVFHKKPMPTWGGKIDLNLDEITYYTRPSEKSEARWEDVPPEIKDTFDRLGIPKAEQAFLAGVGAQYESEMVYHSVRKELENQGVIFVSSDDGLRKHEALFKEHFGTVIPPMDNKFAACNSAVWSGGSFVYVPKGVKVEMPLQAYFRLNTEGTGQFERTLIIVDEGAQVHYVEGCTAPTYSRDSFHSGVIEIVVKAGARCRYTTIQNWSSNVYNLVTQRAAVYEGAVMEWVDANLGSKLTMKYPSCYLIGPKAHGEILSLAVAGAGQHQDTGGKVIHGAPYTTSKITSKSISAEGGRTSYRGLVKVYEGARGSRSNVVCDALLVDSTSRSDTYPTLEIDEDNVTIGHEASVSKLDDDMLFYLKSRGLPPDAAASMVVAGFVEPLVRELPMEYAIELNRLLQIRMSGSVG